MAYATDAALITCFPGVEESARDALISIMVVRGSDLHEKILYALGLEGRMGAPGRGIDESGACVGYFALNGFLIAASAPAKISATMEINSVIHPADLAASKNPGSIKSRASFAYPTQLRGLTVLFPQSSKLVLPTASA